ncbi:MAG TPA: zinc ribbon domain-containing protein [Terracidiphilus sp.]|nr:zinc ribbon domain-containing protein [Terracidiphilus sp.]
MPAYEYQCQSCASRFERRQKMSDPDVDSCPQCGGQVKRLISGGAGVISKGAAGHSAAPACEMGGGCCAPEMGCGEMCGCDN